MARKARQTSGTGIYHVMLRGINRQVIFESNADYSYFIRILYRMVYPMDESRHPQPSLCSIYACTKFPLCMRLQDLVTTTFFSFT
jgi:hypothetical protein